MLGKAGQTVSERCPQHVCGIFTLLLVGHVRLLCVHIFCSRWQAMTKPK